MTALTSMADTYNGTKVKYVKSSTPKKWGFVKINDIQNE